MVDLAVAAGLSWFVLTRDARRPVHRALAALLLLEGALHFFLRAPQEFLGRFSGLPFTATLLALPAAYVIFLARAGLPLVGAFRRPGPRAALLAAAVALQVGNLIGFIFLPTLPDQPPHPGLMLLYSVGFVSFVAASVLGLASAVLAWRRAAPGTPARARARAFAMAFGVRDGAIGGFVLLVLVSLLFLESRPFERIEYLPALGTLAFLVLLAYGILRTQVLDIDAKIRWTLSRGTVAAIFVATYVIASQAAAALLTPGHGLGVGLAAAAALVLGLVPLQRWAERVAARAVPESPAPDVAHRLSLYVAAVEEFEAEGMLAERRAESLARLRARLGLSERDHAVVEHMRRSGGRTPAWAAEPAPGTRLLGRYLVERPLGEGGQGRAFLARDLELGRAVVVKSVRSDLPRERALREARALASLRHPAVATIYDAHAVDGQAVLVMEHVEGGSLKDRLARGPLSPIEFRGVALDLLDALEVVHAAGLVHRDVKPANVLLMRDGRAKLADFGIATLAGAEETQDDALAMRAGGGTARYMSPEQARGLPAVCASDLYAAALTLHEAWTGMPYFAPVLGESAADVRARAARPAEYRSAHGAPPALDAWFARALEPEPGARFASAREMRDALDGVLAAPQAP